jgi:hypothetical protein
MAAHQPQRLAGGVDQDSVKATHFQRGTATAIGAARSPERGPTSLQDGVWTATIDLGNGAEAATATFSAVR